MRNNLGAAYQAMGDHGRALALFEDLLRESPDLGEARYNLARSQQALGQLQRAVDNYLRVPASNYNYHAALNNAGTAYELAGAVDSAAHWYARALSLRPDARDPRQNLQRLLRQLPERAPQLIDSGRLAQLEALCRVLVDFAPGDAHALYYLSASLLLQGRAAASLEPAAKLVRLHPDFEEGYLHLANAYESAGRPRQALATYRAHLEALPGGRLAPLARQRRDALLARQRSAAAPAIDPPTPQDSP